MEEGARSRYPPAMKAVPLAALLLLAAGSAPAAQGPAAREVKEDEGGLDFAYGWPAEAAAIPGLAAALEADMAKQRREALALARADRAERTPEMPFTGHYFQKRWRAHGDTGPLLSLAAQTGTFTGGAHGNSVFETLLWDRAAKRAIELAAVFTDAKAAFAAMTPAYCAELDRQRAERRGEELPLEGADWMTECPPLAERAAAPADSDGDGRFDRIRVLIDPYDAGPYAEGVYEVDIRVTPALRALVRPGYAAAFRPPG